MSGVVLVAGTAAWRSTSTGDGGHGLFETVGAHAGELPLWRLHLARMEAAARRTGLPWLPPADLKDVVQARLREQRHDVARVSLLRGVDATRWRVDTRLRDGEDEPLRVALAAAPRAAEGDADLKLWPRPAWAAARDQARREGIHDVLLWRDEVVLEATAANVFAAVGHRLCTPPADGSILPGIARAELLGTGEPFDVAPLRLRDLMAGTPLLLTNAVYGPRWARLAGGPQPQPVPDLVQRARAAWRDVLARHGG